MSTLSQPIAILQTGRLGDLWYTVPLADYLTQQGQLVEVWYDRLFGNPFTFFPSVTPHPISLPRPFHSATVPANIANSIAQQFYLYARMKKLGRKIIWNQIHPLGWGVYMTNRPYPEHWYRHYPGLNFRRVQTTLTISNDRTLLYFAASVSLRITAHSPYALWLEHNLDILRKHTGYRVIYVPPPGMPDHPVHETWRGSLDGYQQLIARCGLVFGISTSAHVLGQLLGKPIIACYTNRRFQFDTIGQETIRLYPEEAIGPVQLEKLATYQN